MKTKMIMRKQIELAWALCIEGHIVKERNKVYTIGNNYWINKNLEVSEFLGQKPWDFTRLRVQKAQNGRIKFYNPTLKRWLGFDQHGVCLQKRDNETANWDIYQVEGCDSMFSLYSNAFKGKKKWLSSVGSKKQALKRDDFWKFKFESSATEFYLIYYLY